MPSKWDWDSVFAYETFKIVKVKDRRLGMLSWIFTIGILLYLFFDLFWSEKYLKKETPIGGNLRMSLETPKIEQEPSYCNGDELTRGCLYLNPDRVLDPSDRFFITTRVSVQTLENGQECDDVAPTRLECLPEITNSTSYYVAGVENMTLMLEHSIHGELAAVSDTTATLNGHLEISDGKIVQRFQKHEPNVTGGTSMRDPDVPGDIIRVSDLLAAVGVSLEDLSDAPSAQRKGETRRYAGMVIVMLVEYKSNASGHDDLTYKYRPVVIKGAEAKRIEQISPGVQWNRHGIKLNLVQTGEIGHFDFWTLLTYLVASVALFRISTICVELLMLKVLPQKQTYSRFKFETTDGFRPSAKRNPMRDKSRPIPSMDGKDNPNSSTMTLVQGSDYLPSANSIRALP